MRAKKIDSNQTVIVKQLRKCGISVFITSMVGRGFPDLVAGRNGRNFLFEIKDPAKPPSQRKLTEDEQDFFRTWQGQVNKVETVDDILKIVQPPTKEV